MKQVIFFLCVTIFCIYGFAMESANKQLFIEACKLGNINTVKRLMDEGYIDDDGLREATAGNHIELVKLLLSNPKY